MTMQNALGTAVVVVAMLIVETAGAQLMTTCAEDSAERRGRLESSRAGPSVQ